MPNAIDLFAGAGGFSLGAAQAGFDVTDAIEIDAWASDTLAHNHAGTRVTRADVRELDDAWIGRELTKYPDLMIGGPPCQGFSHAAVGRQDPKDPRNSLFREFIRFAEALEPKRIIIENVPGLLTAKTAQGEPVREVILEEMRRLGYHVGLLELRAEEHGVPQIRRRVFFVGDAEGDPVPRIEPTFGPPDLFSPLRPIRTVRDAIGDLPLVDVGDTLDPVPYDGFPLNGYQVAMRGSGTAVHNHVPMRHTPRLVERFRQIAPGQSQTHVGEEHAPRLRVRSAEAGAARYDQNNRRMFWDRPCHTVPATFYANFLHPELHRNFTPREGARIQSFPDSYRFMGKPTVVSQKLLAREGREAERYLSQYVQIGNAVPPLLARTVIEHVTRGATTAATAAIEPTDEMDEVLHAG